MSPIPDELLAGPFTRRHALELGVSARVLEGRRFIRLHHGVWRHCDHSMTHADRLQAARLALPASAHTTDITRIQELGLDFGPLLPLRFVIEGDHHLALDGVFLHRTKRLPALDDVGVTPTAAYLAYAGKARVIDAIKVGDWLIEKGHLTTEDLVEMARAEPWRAGADESLWLLEHLRAHVWSLMESETRSLLTFAGLPEPEINAPLELGGEGSLTGDLVYPRWRTVVEYEGSHHQEDRRQYIHDLGRYELMRRHDYRYVQVTHEDLLQPRRMVLSVHRTLCEAGYDGPAPVFGERWRGLFCSVSHLLGPRHTRQR